MVTSTCPTSQAWASRSMRKGLAPSAGRVSSSLMRRPSGIRNEAGTGVGVDRRRLPLQARQEKVATEYPTNCSLESDHPRHEAADTDTSPLRVFLCVSAPPRLGGT